MAQLNITLNQDEILQLFQAGNAKDLLRTLVQKSLNQLLAAESALQLRADSYQRSDERTDYRNGTRQRELKTRVGTIILNVPRHRNRPFKTMIFEEYSRSEAALVATMAEMVVNGVSTRKVSKVMETLCDTSFSKSTVSEICKKLDQEVEAFRSRPLTGSYPFVTIDATYFKVREKGRIVSKAFMVAIGTNENGRQEILGFGTYDNESRETWTAFLTSLKKRGLTGVLMMTSDAHAGILHGMSRVFPNVPWQRCQFHFTRNIVGKAPKKYQAGLRGELTEMFQCKTLEEARKRKEEIISEYEDAAEEAMRCLDEGFESAMTVMLLPRGLQVYYRTSNSIERLNRELKRRSNVIGIFCNEASIIRLMGSVLVETNDRWQQNRAIFSPATYQKLIGGDLELKLIKLAKEQQQLLAA